MNNVQLLGRMVKDPDVRYTDNGKVVTQFVLAVPRGYNKDKAKENINTDFIPCAAFDTLAERIGNTVSKGQRMLITHGALRINSYKDKQGNLRYHTEIHVQDFDYIERKYENLGTEEEMEEVVF